MNLAKRIGFAIYQINNAGILNQLSHPFSINVIRGQMGTKTWDSRYQQDHIRLTMYAKFMEREDSSLEKLEIEIQNGNQPGKICLLSYDSVYQPEGEWLYQGVWCDITERFLQEVDEALEHKLREMERILRLPSLYQ